MQVSCMCVWCACPCASGRKAIFGCFGAAVARLAATPTPSPTVASRLPTGRRANMPRAVLLAPGTERRAIALDNGSTSIKIGFCGEESPRACVPTHGLDEADGVAPIVGGVVQDWEAMEVYWDHAFTHGLRVDTEQCNVILTANLWETKLNRERLAQASSIAPRKPACCRRPYEAHGPGPIISTCRPSAIINLPPACRAPSVPCPAEGDRACVGGLIRRYAVDGTTLALQPSNQQEQPPPPL